MTKKQDLALIAFEALYDLALGYLENGYKLKPEERLAEKAKLRELKRIAKYQRERLGGGE